MIRTAWFLAGMALMNSLGCGSQPRPKEEVTETVFEDTVVADQKTRMVMREFKTVDGNGGERLGVDFDFEQADPADPRE